MVCTQERRRHDTAESVFWIFFCSDLANPPPKRDIDVGRAMCGDRFALRCHNPLKKAPQSRFGLARELQMLDKLFVKIHRAIQADTLAARHIGDGEVLFERSGTKREQEVLRLVALGYSNKEIAWRVAVSVKSIETYKARAIEKLNLHSRAQIVDFAIKQGWMTSADDVKK